MLTLEIIYERTLITVLNNVSFHMYLNMCTFHVIPLHEREIKTDKTNYEKSVFFLICPKFMKNNVIKSFMNMIPSPR